MPGVAFVLQGAQLDTLARLTLPLTDPTNTPLSQHDCHSALRRIQALHSATTPVTAWLSGLHIITVYTQKKAAAKVYKLLHSNQAQLGITVGPVKQHITLGIQSRAELADALRLAFTTGLQSHGWHKISESRLMSSNPYTINSTITTTACASITVAVDPVSSSTIIVLIKPEIVTFRHPFTCPTAASSNVMSSATPTNTNTNTNTDISALIGTRCTLLPNLLPALIAGIDKDKTLQDKEALINQWNVLSLGLFNPSSSSASTSMHSPSQLLVKVRLTDDPDAPTTTVPSACILSSSGLDVIHNYTLKKSHCITQLLARLHLELSQAAAGVVSLPSTSGVSEGSTAVDDVQQQSAVMVVEKMCVWNYEIEEERGGGGRLVSKASTFTSGFQSADKILYKPSPFNSTIMSFLGPTIDLQADVAGDGTITISGPANALAVTKPRVTAGPQLKVFMAKLREQEEEEENQLMRATAAGKKAVVAFKGLPASTGGGGGAGSSIKTPAFVSKIGAFSFNPGTGIVSKKGLLTTSINNKNKKAKLASTGAPLPTTTTITPVAAAAKPPKLKKTAAVEIDVASLNISQLVQSDELSTLTIPQLKAYLKCVKKPVGGKKSDLEERVKQHVNAMA